MTLSLAFIAPDIIEAVANGTLPRGFGISRLTELPISWAEQRQKRGLRWPEVDLKMKVWTAPPERMKRGVEHRVPLSDHAMAIVTKMAEIKRGEYVFPAHRADRPLSGMAMNMLLRRMSVTGATTHGFRSSFRDWAGECTSFPREVAEAAPAHAVGDELSGPIAAPMVSRSAASAWASFCYLLGPANSLRQRRTPTKSSAI